MAKLASYLILYDDVPEKNLVVSYNATEFVVTGSPPIPWWQDWVSMFLIAFVVITVAFVIGGIFEMLRKVPR